MKVSGDKFGYRRTTAILVFVFCVGAAFMIWQAVQSHDRLVRSTSLQKADHYTRLLSEFRALYTSEVVAPAAAHGMEVSHDYESKDDAIPLPATLSILLGERITQDTNGGGVRLYSDYPFPWRRAGGPRDAFEREASIALQQNPDEAFYRFEKSGGRQVLRYATADVMQHNCVSCHNAHPDSPKTDWKVGDVRGVLEVTLPMDAATAQARQELRGTLFLIGGAGLFGMLGFFIVVRKFRRISVDLADRVEQRTAELKQSRERERKQEQQMSRVVDAAPNGMVMINDQGTMTMVNTKLEATFGYDRSDLLGQPIEMLVPDRFRAEHPEHRRRFFQAPESQPIGEGRELFGVRRDGSEFPVELGLNPIESKDGMMVVAAVVDITQRKDAERELKQYAEMLAAKNAELEQYASEANAANRAKSEFLANMSHELRTPLNAIIGFSEGLLDRVDRHPLNKHQMDRLSKIKRSGDHLLALINNVLDLAKVESGNAEVCAAEFEIEPLVEEVATLVEGILKDRTDVRFRVELESPGVRLHSDRDKIKQILINLVGNAAKFTRQGQITLRIEQDDPYVRLSVEDTGIGIPNDQLPKVFDKFHQVNQPEHHSIKGTGLGLSLCKSFADLLGGVLTVRSIEGQGSTFTLAVPLTYDDGRRRERLQLVEQIKDRCRHSVANGKQLRVLCIEDDPANMEVLVDFLENRGIQVIPAFDGSSGLALVREEQPDAITLDVMMPGLDGWEVLRRLKADPTTAEIPVIITTAIDDKSLAFNLGADGFLPKPIKWELLSDLLGRLSVSSDYKPRTVAIVEDDPEVREILRELLEDAGYHVQWHESGEQFLTRVGEASPDAVVLDLMTADVNGFGVLDALRSSPATEDIPVIVMTARMLSGTDMAQLNGRIRAVIEKNGLSRDSAFAKLIDQLESLKHEPVAR